MYRVAMIEDDLASSRRVADILTASRSATGHPSTAAQFDLQWHAANVAEAKVRILQCETHIDIVLLDLGLPDGRGVDLIPELRQRWRSCVVVAFTVFGDQTTVLEAIEAGVDGYLLKTTDAEDLLETLSSAALGESPISSAVAGFLLRRLRKSEVDPSVKIAEPSKAEPKKDVMSLTARERDVLEALARGFSYREAGKRLGMSQHTVAHHVKNLYPKLTSTSRSEAVFRAMQEGIIKLD